MCMPLKLLLFCNLFLAPSLWLLLGFAVHFLFAHRQDLFLLDVVAADSATDDGVL